MSLVNKKILLGITGGIAAYKIPDLVRKLKKEGAEVRVVVTAAATKFVTSLTLQAVSGNPVSEDLFNETGSSMNHIELAKWADIVVIAPATANMIAKLNHGLADDLLSTLCLATVAPIVLIPAMNKNMYLAVVTQQNMIQLKQHSQFSIWGPDTGEQACGDMGPGRMLEPDHIVRNITEKLSGRQQRQGLHFVITAGPTREALDPVRYISNHSSGQMGFALAKAARDFGAKVTLISGPVTLDTPVGVQRINVLSACEMYNEVMGIIKKAHIFIGCAAVSDYRAVQIASRKLKKQDYAEIKLVKNPDIIAEVAKLTKDRPFVVGFAAETENHKEYALHKLQSKQLDLICANDVSIPDQGFNSAQNAVTLYGKKSHKSYPRMEKRELAKHLIDEIMEHYAKNN